MSVNVGEAIGYLDLDTSGFTKGFKSALQELQAFRNSASSMGDKVTALGSAMTKAGSTMTKGVTLPLVGLGTAAVATTTKFESAMSKGVSQSSWFSEWSLSQSSGIQSEDSKLSLLR